MGIHPNGSFTIFESAESKTPGTTPAVLSIFQES
jgi:hypothetical protein